MSNSFFLLFALFILPLEASAQTDSSPHSVQFVTVEDRAVPQGMQRVFHEAGPFATACHHKFIMLCKYKYILTSQYK